MGTADPRSLCIIGTGRRTWHQADVGDAGAPEPLAMWEEVARLAASDAGEPGILHAVESVQVPYCHSWQYDDPPGRLAERLGAKPAHTHYSGMAGSTVQVLVDQTASRMSRGELDLAIIAGGEALATKRRMRKAGAEPNWSHPPETPRPFPWEEPFHPAELSHEVLQAYLTFALFDTARQGHLGTPSGEYRHQLGAMMSKLSAVAARNPYAWFAEELPPDEIAEPSAANRMVAWPYTKRMTAIMDVDMAAGVLLSTHAKADELGIPAERRVYLRGWCYAHDPFYVAERPDMWRSAAMEKVFSEALRCAGAGIDEVAHLDLYACFPGSVNFARDALGIGEDDSRVPSVTGGLPYHGGPGSNPVTHALATMTEVLRQDPGSLGLVSGVGMHLSKHSAGVYSTTPGPLPVPAEERAQQEVDAEGSCHIEEHFEGEAVVLAGSVVHGSGGEPEWGVLVCEAPPTSRPVADRQGADRHGADRPGAGTRCYAKVFDPAMLGLIEDSGRAGLAGETVLLRTEPLGEENANVFIPAGTLVNVARLA